MASLSTLAQAPMMVPSEMEFAGIKLKITEGAKREIEETLDLLTRSQYHFQLKADRSNLYMHFVEDVLRQEGIPDDFKYLAIQEGEFIADAVSTSNAVGFWQFKKATAQELGLRVDNMVDERKHIIASTIGATKYFKRSNFVFDSWLLSLQSYLQGLTGTQRSVSDKMYGARKVEINKKTHWYIKKYLAHKLAFQDFVGSGRKHPEVKLDAFEGKGKTLRQVSQQVDVGYDELKRFNKWLSQSRIPAEKSYKVIYPVKNGRQPIAQTENPTRERNTGNTGKNTSTGSKANTGRSSTTKPANTSSSNTSSTGRRYAGVRPVEGNVGAFPQITGNRSREYEANEIKLNGIPAIRARSGENLQSLANRTGLSVYKLKVFNDIGVRGNVRADKYYYLKRKKNRGKVHYHIVQPGETLWGIAQDYGIKLKKLLHKNRMRNEEELKVGRVLWLRFIRPRSVPVEYSNVKVVGQSVRAEDRLLQEVTPSFKPPASNSQPTTKEVEKAPEREPEEPDEIFVAPREKKALVAAKTDTIITHLVRPKESFYGISRQYSLDIDDILDWNGLNVMDGLQIDQPLKLVVPKSYFKAREQETSTVKEAVTADYTLHEVKAGETLWGISRTYGVTVEEILKWNNKESNELALGEQLKILKGK
jgi:membrane-bound lytic murein transglycosylase D